MQNDQVSVIGIDLGGTNVRVGLVRSSEIDHIESRQIDSRANLDRVLEQIIETIRRFDLVGTQAIGIGVPGLVDVTNGVVYDVLNIPSWKKVPLRRILEIEFGLPVLINNDSNCFALAERHFGQGRTCQSFLGLIIGTGMAGGLVIDGNLYQGSNCGAGELGMIRYLDRYFEYYCSGQFFENCHGITAKEAALRAKQGDVKAMDIWKVFGRHVGRAIETILLAYDPEKIILGGSVGKSYSLYRSWVLKALQETPYQNSVRKLRIVVSQLKEPGVLGAAALHYC